MNVCIYMYLEFLTFDAERLFAGQFYTLLIHCGAKSTVCSVRQLKNKISYKPKYFRIKYVLKQICKYLHHLKIHENTKINLHLVLKKNNECYLQKKTKTQNTTSYIDQT